MDRFDAMAVLLAVVEEGSLSAGARKLRAPLPTVSRKVAELERHLGTQLLIRTSRYVELTESGHAYIAACKTILKQVQESERAAAGENVAPRGELSLSSPDTFGRRHLFPIVAQFLEEHPEITLKFTLSDRNLDLIEEHVHAALRIGEQKNSSFIATRLGSVRALICASPEYLSKHGVPVKPADLKEHAAISVIGFGGSWEFREGGKLIRADIRSRMVVNVTENALYATLAGLGVSRFMSYQITEELRSGALVPILENHGLPPLPVNLVYSAQRPLPLKVRAFIDWAAPRLRKRLKT